MAAVLKYPLWEFGPKYAQVKSSNLQNTKPRPMDRNLKESVSTMPFYSPTFQVYSFRWNFLFDLRYYVLSARVTLAYRNTGGNRPLYEPPVMNFYEILEES